MNGVTSVPVAVTTSGAGYIAGDCIGGIIPLTLVNYGAGRQVSLKSFTVSDKGGVAPALRMYFFKVTPVGGTYTDNAPVVWGATDAANKIGVVDILTTNYVTDASQSAVNFSSLDMNLPVTATTLFLLLVAEGSYTLAASTLFLDLEFVQA